MGALRLGVTTFLISLTTPSPRPPQLPGAQTGKFNLALEFSRVRTRTQQVRRVCRAQLSAPHTPHTCSRLSTSALCEPTGVGGRFTCS